MGIKPREYQTKMVKEILHGFRDLGPSSGILAQLNTGGGKTLVGSLVGNYFLKNFPDRPHCWVTHRDALHIQSSSRLRQAGLAVRSMTNDPPASRFWYPGKINVVSPSLRSWPELKTAPGLMIIDETHHIPARTWAQLATAWMAAGGLLLGFTATPWRMNKRQGFEEWYGLMVQGPNAEELQNLGFLATPQVISPNDCYIDDRDAEIMATGDYAFAWMESEVSMLLAHQPVLEHFFENTKHLKDKRTMWYTPTVHCANMLTRLLRTHGETAKVLTADTPTEERQRILAQLKYRRITHVVSVDVLGEGIDVPSIPIIATLRPTKSIVVWLQQCGRGARPKNKTGGGVYYIFDYARNVERHGPPDLTREWSLKPRIEYESLWPKEVVARCYNEDCSDIFLHPAHRECWHCGEDQYFICTECHVARRWTRFAKATKICSICIEAVQPAEEPVVSKRRRRKAAFEQKQAKLRSKIARHRRGSKQLTLFD